MNKIIRLCMLFAAVFLIHPLIASAQTVLKGTVKDAAGNPVAGASVLIKGTAQGTTTSDLGAFSINIATAKAALEISSVGFKTKTVALTGETSLDVVLEESKSQLNEVVVVGYGTQKKSDITGAISSIRNKDFKDQPVSNVAQSIQGKVAGILVTTPSGTPGAGLLVSVRGANNPLYVVDGVPMLSESNSSLSTSYNTDGEEMGSGQNISSISV